MTGAPTAVTAQVLLDRAEALGLRLLAAHDGLSRLIRAHEVLRPSRVVTGESADVPGAVVALGLEDVEWLNVRPLADQRAALAELIDGATPAIVVCRGLFPPPTVLELAEAEGIPVFASRRPPPELIADLTRTLAGMLAVAQVVHGGLIQVHNLGVLIVGESGIGKSEAALELILRGHRLVADDVVELERGGPVLLGRGRDGQQHYLEVRGLGVLHAGDLFGQAAILEKVALHLVVELVSWGSADVDRTGLSELSWEALGVAVPLVRLPVRPGRNIALLIEVAARNEILRRRGIHSARRFEAELSARLARGGDD